MSGEMTYLLSCYVKRTSVKMLIFMFEISLSLLCAPQDPPGRGGHSSARVLRVPSHVSGPQDGGALPLLQPALLHAQLLRARPVEAIRVGGCQTPPREEYVWGKHNSFSSSHTTGCPRTSSFSLKISTARERRARKRASTSTSWRGPGTSTSAPSSPTPRAKRGWDLTSATGGWRAEEATTEEATTTAPRRWSSSAAWCTAMWSKTPLAP